MHLYVHKCCCRKYNRTPQYLQSHLYTCYARIRCHLIWHVWSSHQLQMSLQQPRQWRRAVTLWSVHLAKTLHFFAHRLRISPASGSSTLLHRICSQSLAGNGTLTSIFRLLCSDPLPSWPLVMLFFSYMKKQCVSQFCNRLSSVADDKVCEYVSGLGKVGYTFLNARANHQR